MQHEAKTLFRTYDVRANQAVFQVACASPRFPASSGGRAAPFRSTPLWGFCMMQRASLSPRSSDAEAAVADKAIKPLSLTYQSSVDCRATDFETLRA